MAGKPNKGKPSPADELDGREIEILRSVVQEHISTGEPVGSRAVSLANRLDLSPATIRSVMAGLEERGLLTQPHSSAGRLPTGRAYRLYVDRMIGRPRMHPAETQAIDEALTASRGEIAEMLAEASRQLSRFSHQVGVVLAPDFQRIVVEHIEFVRIDDRRVVAVVVGRSGVVHNRILEVLEPLAQAELDQVGRYLSEEFCGRSLPEIRELLKRRMSEDRAAFDQLMARGLKLGQMTLELDAAGAELFLDGASNLLAVPEFADTAKARALIETFEKRRTLVELLTRLLDGGGVQVVIGEEHPSEDLAACSVVARTYGVGDRAMGTVGIVGPTRMEYARAIALVDYLAQVLGRLLDKPDN